MYNRWRALGMGEELLLKWPLAIERPLAKGREHRIGGEPSFAQPRLSIRSNAATAATR
jgi:hypothetical protein